MNNPDDINALNELVDSGYINKADHPELPLHIYNYLPKTQFEGNWNRITMSTRGLVLDDYYKTIIKCPNKFFNKEEPLAVDINLLNARISEKLDGYYISIKADSKWGLIITSRGSFDNKYVDAARKFITDDILLKLVPDYTYFCELLQNFEGDESLILTKHPVPKLVCWAIKDESFNEIIPDDECPFPIAKELSLADAKLYLKQKVEGVVAQDLKTGDRVKIKTEWYIQNHRLLSNCTKKKVWEILNNGSRVECLDIPDEFMDQMLKWQDEFILSKEIEFNGIMSLISSVRKLTDKEIALSTDISNEDKQLIFAFRKHGSNTLSNLIMKRLKP